MFNNMVMCQQLIRCPILQVKEIKLNLIGKQTNVEKII